MPCYDIELPNGVRGIACARGGRRRRCYHCNRLGADRLCDGPVAVNRTCDRPICRACATADGPELDYCRDCARDWPGRQP
jgi:hypothetical protein